MKIANNLPQDITGVEELADEVTALKNKVVTAGGTTYDNSTSGLTADDVQEAIDELASAVSQIQQQLNP